MSNTVEVTVIPLCDFCGENDAAYDAVTIYGPWANQCQDCFDLHGVGLGLGRGQKLTTKN
jgi:hypothetical protein